MEEVPACVSQSVVGEALRGAVTRMRERGDVTPFRLLNA